VTFIKRYRVAPIQQLVHRAIQHLEGRQRDIPIAGSSSGGWETVAECHRATSIANDSKEAELIEKEQRARHTQRAIRNGGRSKAAGFTTTTAVPAAFSLPTTTISSTNSRASTSSGSSRWRQDDYGDRRFVSKDRCFNSFEYGHWARECQKEATSRGVLAVPAIERPLAAMATGEAETLAGTKRLSPEAKRRRFNADVTIT